MTFEEYKKYWDGLIAEAWTIQTTKGVDYAGREDKLANFKKRAAASGISPLQVLSIYMGKHLDSIESFIREGKLESEPIRGRIIDAINYLSFIEPLYSETSGIAPTRAVPQPITDKVVREEILTQPKVKKPCAHKNPNISGTKCEDCGQDLIKGDPTRGPGAIISSD